MADWIGTLLHGAEALCATIEHSNNGMRVIGALLVAGDVLVWRALQRRLRAAFPRAPRAALLLPAIPYALLCLPMLVLALGGADTGQWMQHALPLPYMAAVMAFHFFVWVWGGVLLLALLPRLLHARMQGEKPVCEQRRALLARGALAMPAVIVTSAVAGGLASRQAPVVRRVQLPVRGDYAAMRGLRIAQFSDVHIGSYLERERLEEVADCVNSLRPDIAVCTGDLIDHKFDQIEHGRILLRAVKPRVGTFMCMGNHEYIAAQGDEAAMRASIEECGARLLVDESIKLPVEGRHLWLGGTDFPGTPQSVLGNRPTTRESMDRVLAGVRDDGAPRIVLAHHPRTFFEARERQIDLMLSGHTHGGQISLGRIDDHELTPNLPFEFYHKGLYEHAGRKLYVNSGIGSWLPVRINCPPEVTLIELV